LTPDFDSDPERFAANQAATRRSPLSVTFTNRSPIGLPPSAPAAFLIWAAVTAR
jgi:hypothetical protein